MDIDINTVQQWMSLKQNLVTVKKMEMEQRLLVAKLAFADDMTRKGTHHCILSDEMQLDMTITLYHTIKDGDIRAHLKDLTDAEKEAIKWVPEIKIRQYNKLPPDSLLRKLTSVKPGAPSLSVIDTRIR